MADEGNIVSFSIDVQRLEADKQKTLSIFQELFAELSKYDGKVISPVNIGGLTELREVVNSLDASLAKLNVGMNTLSTNLTKNTSATKGNSNAKKQQKSDYETINKLNEKSNQLGTQAAKIEAALTAEIKQKTKANKDEAESNNKTLQSEKKLQEEEKNSIKLRREAAAEIKRFNKDQRDAEAKALRDKRSATVAQREFEAGQRRNAAAAKREAQEILNLSDSYKQLKIAIKDAEAAYAQAVIEKGKKSPEAQAAFSNLSDLNKVNNTIDKGMSDAGSGAAGFARSLTGILSSLRLIAYVLPGIGLAGVFNLALEALTALGKELFNLQDSLENVEKRNKAINDSLLEQIQLYGRLNDAITDIRDLRKDSIKSQNDEIANNKTLGIADEKTLRQSLKVAEERFKNIQNLPFDKNSKAQQDNINQARELASVIEGIDKIVNSKDERKLSDKIGDFFSIGSLFNGERYNKIVGGVKSTMNEDELKAYKEDLQSRLSVVTENNKNIQDANQEYYDAKNDLDNKQKELENFNYNERIKIATSAAKKVLDVEVEKEQKIIDNQTSTEKQILSALKKQYDARVLYSQKIRDLVLFDNGKPNQRTNNSEKVSATLDAQSENFTLTSEYTRTRQDIINDFIKRDLKAKYDANQAELDSEEKTNEGIFKNETLNFNDRLAAYAKYLDARRQKVEVEQAYENSLDRFRNTTPQEKASRDAKFSSDKQKSSAGSEADISSIVATTTDFELKQLKEVNNILGEGSSASDKYSKALGELNLKIINGKIGFKKFSDALEILNKNFKVDSLKDEVKFDEVRLGGFDKEVSIIEQRVAEAKAKLELSKAFPNPEAQKDAQSLYDAETEALKKALSERALLTKKYNDDVANLTKQQAEQTIIAEQQLAVNMQEIKKQSIELVSELVNRSAENRVKRIQDEQAAFDKENEHEQDAVTRSSLSAADKNAYEIQLKAQKDKADEASEKKQRKLKHDAAVVDRDIAMANIIWSTERAIVNALALPLPPPTPQLLAASYGVLGGIALAKAAARVPAYWAGTPPEGHKGGLALTGEIGTEAIDEPNKPRYYVHKPTLLNLTKGAHVTPTYDVPEVLSRESAVYDGWEQTRYLGSIIKKSAKDTKHIIKNTINIDLGFNNYKNKTLNG